MLGLYENTELRVHNGGMREMKAGEHIWTRVVMEETAQCKLL
jgi:hypothetical protein